MLPYAVFFAVRNQHQEMARRVNAQRAQHRPRGWEILEHVGCGQDIERNRQRSGQNIVADKVFRAEFMPGFAERVVRPVDSPDAALREMASEGVYRFPFRATRSEERRVGKECRSRWSP